MLDTLVTINMKARLAESNVYLVVHNETHDLFFDGNYVLLNLKRADVFRVNYERKRYLLLEAPYSTRCFDYSKRSHKSRHECLSDCMIKSAKRRNRWPSGVPCDASMSINTTVFSKCPTDDCKAPDCKDERYVVKLDRAERLEPKTTIINRIEIGKPDIIWSDYEYSPKLELVEYLCYVGSAISLWFGVSVVGFFSDATVKTIRKVLN